MRTPTGARALILGLAAVTILGLFPAAAVAAPAERTPGELSPVLPAPVPPPGCTGLDGAGGTSSVVRNANGITMQVRATGLEAGHIYSVWFIVIDSDDSLPNVVNAAGGIVNKHGKASFAGHLSAGPIGAVNGQDILGNDTNSSFDDPLGATVILHVIDHGAPGSNEWSNSENMHTIQGAVGCHQEWVNPPAA